MFKIISTYICWKIYIKCNIWRVVVRPSYISDARFLKVNVYKYFGLMLWKWIKISRESLIIKPTRCTNFSNLFLEWNSTFFGQFPCPSSGVFHCTHSNGICHTGLLTACGQELCSILILLASCQQTCMTYTTAVCTVKNSWWWTEELSETCRVSFQE